MKRFTILLVFISFSAYAQNDRNLKTEAYQLRDFLATHHVEPRKVDDVYSADVFAQLLQELDPDKLFFTQSDIEWLSAYKTTIDDELLGKNWVFLARLKERYQSSLQRARFSVPEILKKKFLWSVRESFDPEPEMWAKDETSLLDRQRLWLKYEVLQKISWFMQRDSVTTWKDIAIYEQDAIEHVKKTQLRSIDHILNHPTGFDNYIGQVFFRAITTTFDPHTIYLSAADFQNFKGSLATEDYYFGFTIDDNDDGDITIIALAPGDPAWKSGEIQVSDILIAIKQEGRDAIDLNGMSLEEVNMLLDEIQDHELEFTILKSGGIKKTFRLKKEKMQAEENFVRSFILQGTKKIGYIHLPDFYTRWDDATEGSRCANDVAKEILKLKKDGIDGLILDVRYNGGGSLYEALAMAGIFIDEGALSMLKDNKGKVTVLKDMNRGTVYDEPLVVMVNGQSASASEVLAAAIQDYNRGIIVGSKTYGKATSQDILPLNTLTPPETAMMRGEGFVKVTTERIYRVTGGSLQGRGIVPDVLIPDIYSVIDLRESKTPFALKPDSVSKNSYYKPLAALDKDEIKMKSEARQLADPVFQQLVRSYKWYDNLLKVDEDVSLHADDYFKREMELNAQQVLLRNVYNPVATPFQIKNNSAEAERLKTDGYATQYNQLWATKLKNDLYLAETFQILIDYIDSNKKP